jgi:hypothetical protein
MVLAFTNVSTKVFGAMQQQHHTQQYLQEEHNSELPWTVFLECLAVVKWGGDAW